MEMELKVDKYTLPEVIMFNYEELKEGIAQKVSMYESMVYTDEQIKDAKVDKASLNKLKKALNDERIRLEKEYMQPFSEFKERINEIIRIIDSPVQIIDSQVRAYEEKQKEDKLLLIKEYWEQSSNHPEELVFDDVFNEKWLNTSVSMKKIREEIDGIIDKFNQDMALLAVQPRFAFEAKQEYIRTRDISKALMEINRLTALEEKKAQYEAEQAAKLNEFHALKEAERHAPNDVPCNDADCSEYEEAADVDDEEFIPSFDALTQKSMYHIEAEMTKGQLSELIDFFNERNIRFAM